MIYFCQFENLQTLYAERFPYVIEDRLGGTQNHVYIFLPEYIHLLRIAYTTDCVKDMSELELKMTRELTSYENGYFSSEATVALDQWIMNLYECINPNPSLDDCNNLVGNYTECDGTIVPF